MIHFCYVKYMINRLILQIVAGILSVWVAAQFVQGVSLEIIPGQSQFLGRELTERWQIITLVGITWGLINFFIKPILKALTLPLRILTFGLFSLIINMALIGIVDVVFAELVIDGLYSLFLASLVVLAANFLLGAYRIQS